MDERQEEIQNLLGQLRDVHSLPVNWWPLAPGWWIVALIVLCFCAYAMLKYSKRSNRFKWISLAEDELASLESDFNNSKISAQIALSRLSVLMRRSAMAAKGRQAVARATDEQWINIIADVSDEQGFGRSSAELLAQAPFKAQALSDEQVIELLYNCRAWLAGARKKGGATRV